MIHLQLKARAHDHSFGTRVCRVDSAWLGARAWAGGGAHVAALEGSRVAVYESAVCIVLSGNVYILYTRSREVTWLFSGRIDRFPGTGIKARKARPLVLGPTGAHHEGIHAGPSPF